MKQRVSLARFESSLVGTAGGINLYRLGINEFYLSQYSYFYDQLEAVRSKLEALGMYERVRDALQQAEAMVRQGPERDEEARSLLLNVSGELMKASGTHKAMTKILRENPNATLDDFKALQAE